MNFWWSSSGAIKRAAPHLTYVLSEQVRAEPRGVDVGEPLLSGKFRYLPMVTGTTDDGSYRKKVSTSVPATAVEALHPPTAPRKSIAVRWRKLSGGEVGYSRKTARGASSPAKPALHIPELYSSQFHLSNKKNHAVQNSVQHFSRSCNFSLFPFERRSRAWQQCAAIARR